MTLFTVNERLRSHDYDRDGDAGVSSAVCTLVHAYFYLCVCPHGVVVSFEGYMEVVH